jgi:uncharacterized membrane protein YphA (DoxX/SURF4 family)
MATQRFLPTPANGLTTIIVTETHVNAVLMMLGRILFGGYFAYAGLNHLLHYSTMAVYTAAHGVPAPALAVIGTGAMLFAGGVSIITGVAPKAGAALIAIFLIGVTPIMHAFWNDITPAERAADLANFGKNVGLLGAALFFAALDMTPDVVLRKS